ncbi:hypothetical protein V8D89_007237 [Ganoderma adspersum]
MPSPNQITTAPPSKRSPGERDPIDSWQSFTDSVGSACGSLDLGNIKNEHCWYSQITLADGQRIPVHCSPADPSCASSIMSVASSIYTMTHPPLAPTVIKQTTATSILPLTTTPPSLISKPTMQPSDTTPDTSSGISQMQSRQSDHATMSVSRVSSRDGTLSNGTGNEPTSPSSNNVATLWSSETRSPTLVPLFSLSPTAAIEGSAFSNTGSPTTATSAPVFKSSNPIGAVVGGVVGGLVLTALVATITFYVIRRRRKLSVPPSAEFLHMAYDGSGKPTFVTRDGDETANRDRFIPLVRQGSFEDDEQPPDFTLGGYTDPVLEKVQASAALRDRYGRRDVREHEAL